MCLPRVTVTRELSYRKEEVEDHSGSPPSKDVDPERVPSEHSVTGWSEVIGTMTSLIRSRRGEDTDHK
jgi:hypothetical protein